MINNIEWLSRNALRSYPIVSVDTDIPDDVLVDAFIVVESAPQGVYVSSFSFTSKIASVVFSDVETNAPLGAAMAILGETKPFENVEITPIASNVSGRVAFGPAIERDQVSRSESFFGAKPLSNIHKLEARAVLETGKPPVAAVSVLEFSDRKMTGDITLSLGSDLLASVNGSDVIFSLKDPSRYVSRCETSGSACGCPQTPIITINGVPPDNNGNITIEIIDSKNKSSIVKIPALSLLQFSVLRAQVDLCSMPSVPDGDGRLYPFTTDRTPSQAYTKQ